jgi:putative restriction endonuclease
VSYWWVNHKQTRDQEVRGGYLWSPKQNANGAFNQTYENMRLARPGDVVFSYAGGRIGAIGRVTSSAQSAPKPIEFGAAGENWNADGWRLPVQFDELKTPISPKAHLDRVTPLLPTRHSPIRPDGNGNQGVYLAAISSDLGELLSQISGTPTNTDYVELTGEEALRDLSEILETKTLPATERELLSKARVGQGQFRTQVIAIEGRCRVTGVAVPGLLKASHIKPWRISNNSERLDGNNGLLLAPHVDALFDSGLISFSDDGDMLVSAKLPPSVLEKWSIPRVLNVGKFNAQQRKYLAFHRAEVFNI